MSTIVALSVRLLLLLGVPGSYSDALAEATPAYSCFWSFPGATPASSESCAPPPVRFSSPGNKRVTLKTCAGERCSSVTKTVVVLDPRPRISSVRAAPTEIYPRDQVTLSASVAGKPPLSLEWAFPEGTRTSGSSVSYSAPSKAGRVAITLTVANSSGSAKQTLYLNVREPLPRVSNLSLSPSLPTVGADVAVNAQATGRGPITFSWFLEPDSRSFEGPSFLWKTSGATAGPRRLSLTLTNAAGTTRTTRTFTLRPRPLVLAFEPVCPDALCFFRAEDAVTFRTRISTEASRFAYDWNADGTFEETSDKPIDTHIFSSAGTYRPRLRVTSASGRTETFLSNRLVQVSTRR